MIQCTIMSKKNTKNIKTGQNYTAKKAHTQIYHIHPEMTSKMAQKYQNVLFKKQKLNLKMFSKIKPWSFHPKMLIVKGKTSRSFYSFVLLSHTYKRHNGMMLRRSIAQHEY